MNTAKLGWYFIKLQAPIPQRQALFRSGLSAIVHNIMSGQTPLNKNA